MMRKMTIGEAARYLDGIDMRGTNHPAISEILKSPERLFEGDTTTSWDSITTEDFDQLRNDLMVETIEMIEFSDDMQNVIFENSSKNKF